MSEEMGAAKVQKRGVIDWKESVVWDKSHVFQEDFPYHSLLPHWNLKTLWVMLLLRRLSVCCLFLDTKYFKYVY